MLVIDNHRPHDGGDAAQNGRGNGRRVQVLDHLQLGGSGVAAAADSTRDGGGSGGAAGDRDDLGIVSDVWTAVMAARCAGCGRVMLICHVAH